MRHVVGFVDVVGFVEFDDILFVRDNVDKLRGRANRIVI